MITGHLVYIMMVNWYTPIAPFLSKKDAEIYALRLNIKNSLMLSRRHKNLTTFRLTRVVEVLPSTLYKYRFGKAFGRYVIEQPLQKAIEVKEK